MSLSSITPMPRIISRAISIAGYKYEHPFQRLVDDLINYDSFLITLMKIERTLILCDESRSIFIRGIDSANENRLSDGINNLATYFHKS